MHGVSRLSRALAVVLALACLWTTAGTIALVGPANAGPAQTGDVAYDSGLQWGLDRIAAREGWVRATGRGTTIAVIDSGVSLDHEDLASNLVAGVACRQTGGESSQCSGEPADDDGHGSHVAGIAAAVTGNGTGIAGVAPDARIMPIKVLFKACPTCQATGNAGDVAAGIRWAADRGADVINLSLGSTTSSVFGAAFADAVRYAWDRGSIPVVAAGNQFVLTADFGDAPAVVVSATDRDDGAPSYSNGVGRARWAVSAPGGEAGDTSETCAPGGDPAGVLSTYWAEGDDAAYACLSGTSMAAPHVAGALAVLLSTGASPQAAVDVLLGSATDIGLPGRDEIFGSGRIDLAAATARIGTTPLSTPSSTAPAPVETSAPGPLDPPVTVPSGDPAPPTTTPAGPTVPDGALDERSMPQVFYADEDGVPVVATTVAAAAIAVVAAAMLAMWRRRLL